MPSLKWVHVEEDGGAAGGSIIGGHASARSRLLGPLSYSGLLDKYEQQDTTPVIGREYHGLQVADLLDGSVDIIRDLAITSMFTQILIWK
jgi:hypothetical protein